MRLGFGARLEFGFLGSKLFSEAGSKGRRSNLHTGQSREPEGWVRGLGLHLRMESEEVVASFRV